MSKNLLHPSCYRKILMLCLAFMFSAAAVMAQGTSVTGKVTDNTTKEPLPGVSVAVKSSNGRVGTITDANGNFTINAAQNDVLIATSVGYARAEVTVTGSTVNITLNSESKALSDVVVIGFGSRKKKDITSAISTVGSADIDKSTALSPELALQGQAAGVNVTSAGSDPSARPTVRIRGISTFNAADPLYVIDGIPLLEGGAGALVDPTNGPTLRGTVNIYNIINPNDIESISVLKDAAAAAIYGVRAANGVILITTKRGKKGTLRIDFDAQAGKLSVPKTYDVLTTQQYTKYYTDAYNAYPQLTGTTPVPIGNSDYFGAFFDPASPKYIGNMPTYDWQNELQNKNASLVDYNVRASGGSDNTTYNLSAGYSRNDGAFKGVTANRYTVASNVDSKFGKYIEVGLNLRLIQGKSYTGALDGTTNNLGVYKAAPFQPIYGNGPNGYAPLYTVNAPITPSTFNISKIYGVQSTAINNYLGMLSLNTATNNNQSVIGTAFVQITPVKDLRIRGTYSGTQFRVGQESYRDFNSWQFSETPKNPYDGFANPPLGSTPNALGMINSVSTSIQKTINVNYLRSFGEHNFDITFDASQQSLKWTSNGQNGSIYTTDPALRYYGTSPDSKSYYSNNANNVVIGLLGRISYNYKSKYYIDAVYRNDRSSKFDLDHNVSNNYGISGAWRITSEDFMKGVTWLNDLKLRAGYGGLGNDQTTAGWQFQSNAGTPIPSYNLGDVQASNPGIAFVSFPNKTLTWENKYTTNVGFDAVMFNNSFNLTVEYYRAVTKGIIQSFGLNPITGIQRPVDDNLADVLNRGFEVSAGYNKTIGKVGFNVSGNLTTVHNEVLKLADNNAIRGSGYSLEVGQPIGYLYGYKVGGIFQNQADIDAYTATTTDQSTKQQKPGDIYFQDLYGSPAVGSTAQNPEKDGLVNSNDQTNIGNVIPTFYYGFTLGLNYAGFDVSAFFQGKGGFKKYNYARAAGETAGYGRNLFSSVLNAWTPSNTNTDVPRAVYQDPNANGRFSDRFVESGAYLRFQNLTVGYTVPKAFLSKTNLIQNLRIAFTGINLLTVTDYTGVDPENDFSPSTRQFLLSLRASF
ncbi:TonB-dependent receptor [Mucilaginibacter terrigena]|uniref:TonB-dependent receptor n=1 Tax=Mucilaginibacter terrigena TaxID=2492395 RepID=A0A4Q5LRE8_9SPHI|nr:TonB-dependent receptor [Mucilaginibacter terrigena]RYU92116.1 TonB-dependent receptor [Mucilaginibacter terrigena]